MTEEQKYMLLASLTAQIMQQPSDGALYLKRAETYLAINDVAKALDDAEQAIALSPDLAEAYLLRGQLRFKLHDRAAAFEDLKKATSLNPDLLESISGEYKTKDAPKTYKF